MGTGGVESGVEDSFYVRGGEEGFADEMGVCVYAVDAGDKVSAVAFEEDDVLGPADVFV